MVSSTSSTGDGGSDGEEGTEAHRLILPDEYWVLVRARAVSSIMGIVVGLLGIRGSQSLSTQTMKLYLAGLVMCAIVAMVIRVEVFFDIVAGQVGSLGPCRCPCRSCSRSRFLGLKRNGQAANSTETTATEHNEHSKHTALTALRFSPSSDTRSKTRQLPFEYGMGSTSSSDDYEPDEGEEGGTGGGTEGGTYHETADEARTRMFFTAFSSFVSVRACIVLERV